MKETKGKYHVAPNGVERCKAEPGACSYEPNKKNTLINHFETEKEAQNIFEKAMLNYVSSKFGTIKVPA